MSEIKETDFAIGGSGDDAQPTADVAEQGETFASLRSSARKRERTDTQRRNNLAVAAAAAVNQNENGSTAPGLPVVPVVPPPNQGGVRTTTTEKETLGTASGRGSSAIPLSSRSASAAGKPPRNKSRGRTKARQRANQAQARQVARAVNQQNDGSPAPDMSGVNPLETQVLDTVADVDKERGDVVDANENGVAVSTGSDGEGGSKTEANPQTQVLDTVADVDKERAPVTRAANNDGLAVSTGSDGEGGSKTEATAKKQPLHNMTEEANGQQATSVTPDASEGCEKTLAAALSAKGTAEKALEKSLAEALRLREALSAEHETNAKTKKVIENLQKQVKMCKTAKKKATNLNAKLQAELTNKLMNHLDAGIEVLQRGADADKDPPEEASAKLSGQQDADGNPPAPKTVMAIVNSEIKSGSLQLMQHKLFVKWVARNGGQSKIGKECKNADIKQIEINDACPCEIWACTRESGLAARVWMHVFVEFKVYFIWMSGSDEVLAIESVPAPMAAVHCVEKIKVHNLVTMETLKCAAACNSVLMMARSRAWFPSPLGHGCSIPVAVDKNRRSARRRQLCATITVNYLACRNKDVDSANQLVDSAAESIGVMTTKRALQHSVHGKDTVEKITKRFVPVLQKKVECDVANPESLSGNTNLYRLLSASNQTSLAHSSTASLLGIASHTVFDAVMVKKPGYQNIVMAMPLCAIVVGMAAHDALVKQHPKLTNARVGKLALWPMKSNMVKADGNGKEVFCGYRPDLTFEIDGKLHCVELKTVWRAGGSLPSSTVVRHKMQAYLQGCATEATVATLVTVNVPFNTDVNEVNVEILECLLRVDENRKTTIHEDLNVPLSDWWPDGTDTGERSAAEYTRLSFSKGTVRDACLSLALAEHAKDDGPYSFTFNKRKKDTNVNTHDYPLPSPTKNSDPKKLNNGDFDKFLAGMTKLASTPFDV
jgi:hypothetical protein